MSHPKVTIVVAVFNVEKYIERCAVSLWSQTLDDIEYVFMDDCSTDNSVAILENVLERFPNRANSVKIIRNLKNSQVAYTRTIGMKAATGEYVIHCDPNDFVDLDYYEIMYRAAKDTDSDIVAANYYKETEGVVEEIKVNYYSSCPKDCIKNIYWLFFS